MAKKKQPDPDMNDPDIYPTEEIPGHLPGMSPIKNVKVHNKAVALHKAREEYNRAAEAKADAENTLLMVMNAEGVDEYHYGDVNAYVNTFQKVKLKIEARKPEEATAAE